MRRFINLQTDLLRTFVSVVELGGHSKAGAALGRSQPAISLQIRRLEDLVGATLLTQDGRTPVPTQDGELLLGFAREMVRINDEAVSYFHRAEIAGVLRIGLPTDYAVAFLRTALTDFSHAHPEVELEIRCDLSRKLHRQLRADELDIIIAVMPSAQMPYLSRSWVERPVWAAAETFVLKPASPVPLAAHPEGCEYRSRMVNALDAASRRWRIVYVDPGISGIQNAVLNGLCVSAVTRATLLPGMRILDASVGFPPLESLRVGLFYKHPRLSDAGLKLVSDLVNKLDTIGAGENAHSA
ncbi:LysR substrate-binding domain-containing protein [Defluviimonas sp. WL0024]|uniref:LysR substrate-binding domain-containing protein n=1 Tax=Albidovulum salinarum TaxID=2984153 RepID=A0ABT2X4W5_9RHOB|nr:LysR substrate-binding domain-containing protein [Defluviimonas sp. WL0024]MCU9848982.1 LysR substrate-binding domain-containing protein [Defluviimonas sp. WL0024]